MRLTTSRMRAINAVFEAGSFSAAARRLGLSQPAIAQQIRDLELEFHVRLFDRRGNGLAPTPLCRQLVGVTSRLHGIETDALSILKQHEQATGGELRIGLGNSMPGMALVSAFIRQFPSITVQVEMGTWGSILEAVSEQRVDLGILPDVPDDGRFRREVCLRQSVVAIAHPRHPLAGIGRVSCTGLMQERLIFRTRGSSTQRVVDRAFRNAGLTPRPAITLDTRDGVFEAVSNRIGIGFMWELGSSRTDSIVKLAVPDMAAPVAEHVFCLAGTRERLVEMFFSIRETAMAARTDRHPDEMAERVGEGDKVREAGVASRPDQAAISALSPSNSAS